MPGDERKIVEALIFASDFPVSVNKLSQLIDDITEAEIEQSIAELIEEYNDRGITLQKVAGGYEFVTSRDCRTWVNRLMAGRRSNRLSRAGLETVSIVAYNQPVTRSVIEEIRGVDCGGPLRTLLERKLIVIAGREKAPGRPLVYKTSEDFLRYFGIDTVTDLPRMEEVEEIIQHGKKEFAVEQLSSEVGSSGEAEGGAVDSGGSDNGQ